MNECTLIKERWNIKVILYIHLMEKIFLLKKYGEYKMQSLP